MFGLLFIFTSLLIIITVFLMIKSPKNLIFTSFGNNHNVRYWNSHPDQRKFDIIGVDYKNNELSGDDHRVFTKVFHRKGGKFQNFCHFYKHHHILFKKYEYIAVWDDDIMINTLEINEAFDIMRRFRLTIGMPSFSSEGKISHWHTEYKPGRLLTFTNFIEMNVPIFHYSVLPKLTADGYYSVCNLTGWGIDHIYMNLLYDKKYKFAVIHKVKCINPFDSRKKNKREIDALEALESRQKSWEEIKKKVGIREIRIQEYDSIGSS